MSVQNVENVFFFFTILNPYYLEPEIRLKSESTSLLIQPENNALIYWLTHLISRAAFLIRNQPK